MTRREPSATPVDPALVVAASRARTQEILVAGLLHDLNGPLNNVRLTLELLARVLARQPAGDADTAAAARVRRYLDTLTQESARMTAWTHVASAALAPAPAASAPDALAALLAEAQRLFRHHAALSEVRLDVASDTAAEMRVVDAAATRALLATLLCAAIALATAGGTVRVDALARDAHARVRAAIAPASDDAARALAHSQDAPRSPLELDLASVRVQARSLHGDSSLRVGEGAATLEVALPRA